MSVRISPLADVHPQAQLGVNVQIGPFCSVGPHVSLGDDCQLFSHVALTGHTEIGRRNRFWPGSVVGSEPQDSGYKNAPTRVEIGDDNQFREGVTVHRGAEKEDGVTRIGSNCTLMVNAHVGHNSRLHNHVTLVNGSLLGGHVHMYDYSLVSGNTVVHQFCSIGTVGFVSGGCRVVTDVPPYMLAVGTDNPGVASINLVGMKRRGISDATIRIIRQAYKWMYREHKPLAEICALFAADLGTPFPPELQTLLDFCAETALGRNGRGREAVRSQPFTLNESRRAA